MFPNVSPVSHRENIASIVSFCFQDAYYTYATREEILRKIRASEQLQTFCEDEYVSTRLIFRAIRVKAQFF